MHSLTEPLNVSIRSNSQYDTASSFSQSRKPKENTLLAKDIADLDLKKSSVESRRVEFDTEDPLQPRSASLHLEERYSRSTRDQSKINDYQSVIMSSGGHREQPALRKPFEHSATPSSVSLVSRPSQGATGYGFAWPVQRSGANGDDPEISKHHFT